MTWTHWNCHLKPSSVDFCLSCGHFEWSHDQFTTILSLGQKWPKILLMKSFTFAPFVFVFPPGLIEFRCWSSHVLEKYICKFRFGREYMREKCVGWFFRGKRFQAVSARNCFTEFAAVSRHKFCPATARKEAKIETSDEVFVWDTSCNFETTAGNKSIDPVIKVASNASDAKCCYVLPPPFAPKCFPKHVFVDGGNNIKWTYEKLWIHKCVNAQGCWKRKQVTLRD